jgi:hypothetical protein
LNVDVAGETAVSRSVTLPPVPRLTVYVLPHSHNDIGYTEVQTAVEKKQVNNLVEGIKIARRTARYPPGSRFVWNMEVLWAADLYLHRMDEQQRAFISAGRARRAGRVERHVSQRAHGLVRAGGADSPVPFRHEAGRLDRQAD